MHVYDTFARLYDADFAEHTADIVFYRDLARQTGGPILELMCGSGRVLVPLAADGFAITGVDSSPEMLAVAREHLDAAGLSAGTTLIQADARTVELPQRHFGLAIVALNSFGHLEQIEDQLATLAIIRRTLKRTGALVIDMQNPDPARLLVGAGKKLSAPDFMLGERVIHKSVSYYVDLPVQISSITFHYNADGEPEHDVQVRLRWFYRFELEHLLARAGFRVRGVCGSYDFADYGTGSEQLILIASPAPLR